MPTSRPAAPAPVNVPPGGRSAGDEFLYQMKRIASIISDSADNIIAKDSAILKTYEGEYGYNVNTTLVNVTPNTSNYVLVKTVVACIPTGATGLLTLGGATVPLVDTITHLQDLGLLLATTDVRQVLSSTAGAVSLVLTGTQISPQMLTR